MELNDSLKQALTSGNPPLADFLDWIGDRLEHVYHESPNVDFVRACHRHANEIRTALEDTKKWRVTLGTRYFIVRWKPGPFKMTWQLEFEFGLTRWL